jgi:hypothetical protein
MTGEIDGLISGYIASAAGASAMFRFGAASPVSLSDLYSESTGTSSTFTSEYTSELSSSGDNDDDDVAHQTPGHIGTDDAESESMPELAYVSVIEKLEQDNERLRHTQEELQREISRLLDLIADQQPASDDAIDDLTPADAHLSPAPKAALPGEPTVHVQEEPGHLRIDSVQPIPGGVIEKSMEIATSGDLDEDAEAEVQEIMREMREFTLTEPRLSHEDYADELARILVHLVCDGQVRL